MARPKAKSKPKGKDKEQETAKPQKARFRIRPFRLFFDLLLCFVALTVIPVLLYRVVNPPSTPLMWIRWVESGYDPDSPRVIPQWTPLSGISPHLVRAVLSSEDQKFYEHNGFDWEAAEAAFHHNLKSDKKIGASTISMQTARNVFLWQERNWLRKSLEAYFTFLIETFWGKDRILEVYFNVIEWGDGVFGCTDAAQTYYKHSPKKMSPLESAWMAAILPNPRKWSLDPPSKQVEIRQARILNSMKMIRLPQKS